MFEYLFSKTERIRLVYPADNIDWVGVTIFGATKVALYYASSLAWRSEIKKNV